MKGLEVEAGADLQPFSSSYDSEQACMAALIAAKWPDGFVCPRCAHTRCRRLTSRKIPLLECASCAHQTSPLVGTMFEQTHLPLMKWFKALELFLLPDGISAVRLHRVIRVTYKTAWLMLHKIRHTFGEFEARERLSGEVKVNSEAYGGNPSRFSSLPPYALAVVAGCTVTESGEPEQIKLRLVSQNRGDGRRAKRHELAAFIDEHVDARTSAVQVFPLAFRLYVPLRKEVRAAWQSLTRTYGALGLQHLQAYLNEYTGRRRLCLSGGEAAMREKFLRMGAAIPAITYRRLIASSPNRPPAGAA